MNKQAPKKFAWPKVRKLINTIHLWLGLASGLVVIAICFSGTIYVFNTEITEWGAPHLYEIENYEGKQRIDADSLLAKVQVVAGGKVSSVNIPAALNRTYQFSVRKTAGKKPGPAVTYFVNPYSGEIAGTSKDKNSAKEFMSDMFSLHRWLLLDKVEKPIINGIENRKLGSMITGWATIIFTLGCISGLIIWFPQKLKSWKQGLKIKWRAGWKRLNHDLHNSLAFYAVFFLLLMGLTGPQWSFEWYREGLQKTLGTYKPAQEAAVEKKKETHPDSSVQKAITIAEYLETGDSLLAHEGNYAITLPAEPGAKTMIAKTKLGFFAPAASDRVMVDPVTGKVIKVDIFSEKPFNERVAGSIKAIHVGNVYGTFTKLIYFLACLIATSLPITGTMIWLNKMKKSKKKSKAVKQENVTAPAVA